MPPSVTTATVAPPRSASTSSGVRRSSLPSKYDTTRPATATPRPRASRCSRRVSSAATTSALVSAAFIRSDASAGLPSGAPTRTSRPIPNLPWVSSVATAAYDRSVTAAVLTEPELRAPQPTEAPGPPAVPELTRRRLVPDMPPDGWRSWIPTALVTGIAAILHLVGLSKPKGMIFDEIYYAKEGQDLLRHGIEWDQNSNTGAFVVHPPLGKWLIGWGQAIFGQNEFGWRIAAAVFGTLAVLVVTRLGRRMFRSTVLGCTAGLLMTLDGLQFVLSRSALLDIFLMFFILAAFACLVRDRDQRRRRWLRALEAGLDPARGDRPGFAVPWWRLGAAAMIGCAMSVKWSALWYILLLGLLVLLWEAGARRSAGVRRPGLDTVRGGLGRVVPVGVLVLVLYLASWTGWFLTDPGYDRHWLAGRRGPRDPILRPVVHPLPDPRGATPLPH